MQGTRNQNSQVIHSSLFCSAIQILIEIVESYKARSVQVYFVRLREQPYSLFKKSKLLDLIGLDHLFSKVSEAIEVIEQDTNKRHMGWFMTLSHHEISSATIFFFFFTFTHLAI